MFASDDIFEAKKAIQDSINNCTYGIWDSLEEKIVWDSGCRGCELCIVGPVFK